MREFCKRIWRWLIGWLTLTPHFVVATPDGGVYMNRWYILPRNPWMNVYLHQFLRDDEDRALHDHPWTSISLLVRGRYIEVTADGEREYRAGSVIRRSAEHAHRIKLVNGKPAWTLFITGRIVREWGFHCPQGWKHWRDFTNGKAGQPGPGCEEVTDG